MARSRGSTGAPPRSSDTATLSRAGSTEAGAAKDEASSRSPNGSRLSRPTWASSSSRVSATVRPIGPSTVSGDQPSGLRSFGTRPGEGRNPTTPQNAAGMRSDPPVSEPVASGTMPDASATAEPPDEPPHVRFGS